MKVKWEDPKDIYWEFYQKRIALAGVVQWTECRPVNQKVAGSILIQGTCQGCGPGPQLGAYRRQPHIDDSLPLFLPPFPSS